MWQRKPFTSSWGWEGDRQNLPVPLCYTFVWFYSRGTCFWAPNPKVLLQFFLSALLNIIRGESYMQNRGERERVYSLIHCVCLKRHGHLGAFFYLAFCLSGISGMPIPLFLHADLLVEVFVRRRRAIYFLEFILHYWNEIHPSKKKERNKGFFKMIWKEITSQLPFIHTVYFKLLFCQSST